ncbi:kynureninase [Burkholderiales bacterium]|nr:kynureninase [Burkholderiales bacterium]
MNAPRDPGFEACASAAAALGAAPWPDARVRDHVAPLFSRHLAAFAGRAYLANHSLGRPLDAAAADVGAGLDAWYAAMGDAWEAWGAEELAHRARIAAILGASRADAVVPKTSAGQGLRAVLGSYDRPPRVVSTHGEFDSLDLILREWARRGRLSLEQVAARPAVAGTSDHRALPHHDPADLIAAIAPGTDLVVVSEVMFQTGERLPGLPDIVAHAHARGAKVLLDVYHSMGVYPVDVAALDVDFAVGGSYKYLRGGPGACFLYVAPRWLDAGLRTLDTGWFAKDRRFEYRRPDPPEFARGGDGWLESTPPALTPWQARAGQRFVLAFGAAALREDSLARQAALVGHLTGRGIAAIGGTPARGAFVVVPFDGAPAGLAARVSDALGARGIVADARGPFLRLCPDLLSTADDLERTARELAAVVPSVRGGG